MQTKTIIDELPNPFTPDAMLTFTRMTLEGRTALWSLLDRYTRLYHEIEYYTREYDGPGLLEEPPVIDIEEAADLVNVGERLQHFGVLPPADLRRIVTWWLNAELFDGERELLLTERWVFEAPGGVVRKLEYVEGTR